MNDTIEVLRRERARCLKRAEADSIEHAHFVWRKGPPLATCPMLRVI